MKALRDFSIMVSVTLLLLLVGLVLIEGVNTLRLYKKAQPSLTYRALSALEHQYFPERVRRRIADSERRIEAERQRIATEQSRLAKERNEEEGLKELQSRNILFTFQIEQVLGKLRQSGILLGNSPYEELITNEARVVSDDPAERYRVKPNLAFEGAFLRTRLYDSNNLFYYYVTLDRKKKADPEALQFLAQYGFHPVVCHTDESSNRVTVPASHSNDIILVVGDSVAFGIDINDDETLASQLQKADPTVRYINASCPGAKAPHNLARMKRLFAQHGNKIKGVIYVNCENDFDYGPRESQEIVGNLADLLDAHHVPYRVFVYTSFITRTIPEIFRTGSFTQNIDIARFISIKKTMQEESLKRGFQCFVDFGQIVHDYQNKLGTLYGGAALYNDECHLSPEGIRLIAAQIPPYSRTTSQRSASQPKPVR